MSEKFSLKEAEQLIAIARKSIEYYSATRKILFEPAPEKKFEEKLGVFVTLNKFPDGELRGCIGFPQPTTMLWEAVIEAAAGAGFSDPRFPPLKAEELEKITVEISILTKPKPLVGDREKFPKQIETGKDGLIIRKGFHSGLLLPQVAKEYNWNGKTFLEQTCKKAGLMDDAWKKEDSHIFKFQAQIFKELEPRGRVVEES